MTLIALCASIPPRAFNLRLTPPLTPNTYLQNLPAHSSTPEPGRFVRRRHHHGVYLRLPRTTPPPHSSTDSPSEHSEEGFWPDTTTETPSPTLPPDLRPTPPAPSPFSSPIQRENAPLSAFATPTEQHVQSENVAAQPSSEAMDIDEPHVQPSAGSSLLGPCRPSSTHLEDDDSQPPPAGSPHTQNSNEQLTPLTTTTPSSTSTQHGTSQAAGGSQDSPVTPQQTRTLL